MVPRMDISPVRERFRRPIDPSNIVYALMVQGELITVKGHLIDYEGQLGGKRGTIKGFSRASRLRMLKFVATLDWPAIRHGVFLTLTFPDSRARCGKAERNQYRHTFFRAMENHLGSEIGALWRCEWMVRKTGKYVGKLAPHFHLVIPGVRFIAKDKVKDLWRKSLGVNHYVSAWIDSLQTKRKQAVYIAKYCAKEIDASVLDCDAYLNTGGRHWGYHRKHLIPQCERRDYFPLPDRVAEDLRRTASWNLTDYRMETDPGFSLFGEKGQQLADAMEKMAIDGGSPRCYN